MTISDFAFYRPDGLVVDCGLIEDPPRNECYRVVLRGSNAWQRSEWLHSTIVGLWSDRPLPESVTMTSEGLAASESTMVLDKAWDVWMNGCGESETTTAGPDERDAAAVKFAEVESETPEQSTGPTEIPYDPANPDFVTATELIDFLRDDPFNLSIEPYRVTRAPIRFMKPSPQKRLVHQGDGIAYFMREANKSRSQSDPDEGTIQEMKTQINAKKYEYSREESA
jgi:hypothetical protein